MRQRPSRTTDLRMAGTRTSGLTNGLRTTGSGTSGTERGSGGRVPRGGWALQLLGSEPVAGTGAGRGGRWGLGKRLRQLDGGPQGTGKGVGEGEWGGARVSGGVGSGLVKRRYCGSSAWGIWGLGEGFKNL
jgi:hypothetical protein